MQKQILVVDDEMVMRSLIAIAMQRNGYNVTQMDNPFKALTHLDRDVPDLIILDLMMPGMNGIELCRRIREHSATAGVPVVIFSARDDEHQIQEAMNAGATAYAHKLQPACDLVEIVNSLLTEVTAAAI
jgi:DNA-binding response OmpR family regulator